MEKLFIDLESIITSEGRAMTEKMVEKANYTASNDYLQKISDLYSNNSIDHEAYRALLDSHYNAKDVLMEEVDENFKGAIDYSAIYTKENINEEMMDYINQFRESTQMYIIFYYNVMREYKAKKLLCEETFNNVPIIGIKYYLDPYQEDKKRKRTNKAQYVKQELNLSNLKGCCLIDKSTLACREWTNELGFATTYYDSIEKDNTFKTVK